MFGKSKKIVNLAYKEKLLAEIAHYDKRIEEALSKRKQNSFEDESFGENVTNPYKFKVQPSQFELKQREANLSNRASMSLELAMLTVMQSEVNVMVTPPEVRKAVQEDGVWHEVAAECKIDLVSFMISFYAHKPHRKFAPTRFRNLAVALVKPAHQKELAQSILPKLQLPNLALQPEGGYRVRFLDLLQVDWSLENLWSPIVPFCHRMKFEVEYMPKDYISAIGKLYKQFKDPSLETSERTSILSKIFDICLQAAGPARKCRRALNQTQRPLVASTSAAQLSIKNPMFLMWDNHRRSLLAKRISHKIAKQTWRLLKPFLRKLRRVKIEIMKLLKVGKV
ncbi:uncharacterized protein LOC125240065 [Leguminivora glycinivorella]|uniref:uncharacterized protein LOC125240065 n=1 Tax=Leguminivora glycinivorella TaxID=1035111 RepID=UPI00200E7DD4|nr:uncharacterized protein LOC125240065 [Leguminivora glycinivorella]